MDSLKLQIPNGFLEAETRCGYFVSAEMKKVWAVELDLLAELLRVCGKHGLQAFVNGGTLLGAVRHKGFVPWDDDIDLVMFREDYSKLCQLAPEEFRHPYFFQTFRTDSGCMSGFAKLMNEETTAMTEKQAHSPVPMHLGIFIDIFPLDNVIDDAKLFKKQKKKIRRWRSLAFLAADFTTRYQRTRRRKDPAALLIRLLHPLLGNCIEKSRLRVKCLAKASEAMAMYNDRPTDLVANICFSGGKFTKRRSDMEYGGLMPFEFIQVPVCKGYEDVLDRQFGDWHQFVRRKKMHCLITDADKSYKDYFSRTDL